MAVGSNEGTIEFATSRLRDVELLSDCSDGELTRLAESCRKKSFRAGQYLFYEDADAPGLHIILSGEVFIQRSLPFGEILTIATRGPGEFLGELSLIDGSPASAAVVAATDVQALILRPVAFRSLLDTSHKTCLRLVEALARRLRSSTDSIAVAHGYSVKDRLSLLLLELAESTPDVNVLRISLPSTQRELGERIGATRESVNKAIAQLVSAGVLSPTKQKRTFLANRHRLMASYR